MTKTLRAAMNIRSARVPLMVAAGVTALVAGFLAGVPTAPPAAHAGCGTPDNCYLDSTVTADLNVRYIEKDEQQQEVAYVEPSGTTTWLATATWSTTGSAPYNCDCLNGPTAAAYIDVSWSDVTETWTATCTSGCNAVNGPIYGVTICNAAGCPSADDPTQAWAYELALNVKYSNGTYLCTPPGWNYPYTLSQVAFSTTSVPNGNVVDHVECTEGSSVTPDSAGYSATDYGTFECGYSCDANGPAVDIVY